MPGGNHVAPREVAGRFQTGKARQDSDGLLGEDEAVAVLMRHTGCASSRAALDEVTKILGDSH